MGDCPVCCEPFTKNVRKAIECPACHYIACMKCLQTFLTTNPVTECMSCRGPWTKEFIDSTFSKAWVGGAYSRFRCQVLLDIEKAQLPGSQYLVQNYNLAERLRRKLESERFEEKVLRERLTEIQATRWNDRARIERIKRTRYQSDGFGNEGDLCERRSFVRACPVEGCRGFLSSQLKCGICETFACGDCFGIVGPTQGHEHVCDPGDLQTAKLIRKESRPCPRCGIFISKIDGCDQMWCIQCRTAFSWRTGSIVTGTIHNPHYFEMLRRESRNGDIPRQPGDEQGYADRCMEVVTDPGVLTYNLHRKLRTRRILRGDMYDDIMDTQRHVCHLYDDTLRNLRNKPMDMADLRMNYLLGRFNEETFKKKLMQREKDIEKHTTLISCYEARVQMTIDLVQSYLRDELNELTFLERVCNVGHMMEGFLEGIRSRFNCVVEVGPRLRQTYTGNIDASDSSN